MSVDNGVAGKVSTTKYRKSGLGVQTGKWRTMQSSAGHQDRNHTLQLRGEINRHSGDDEDCNTGIDQNERLVVDRLA